MTIEIRASFEMRESGAARDATAGGKRLEKLLRTSGLIEDYSSTVRETVAAHRVDQLGGQHSAGGADRLAMGDGAALDGIGHESRVGSRLKAVTQ